MVDQLTTDSTAACLVQGESGGREGVRRGVEGWCRRGVEGGCIERKFFQWRIKQDVSYACELDSILCSKKFQYSLTGLNMADYVNKYRISGNFHVIKVRVKKFHGVKFSRNGPSVKI